MGIGKILYNDTGMEISEYQTGIIPLILTIVKIKKAINLFQTFVKKEEFVDGKSKSFMELPIKDQENNYFVNKKNFLVFLNLPNEYIMSLIKLEFKKMCSL